MVTEQITIKRSYASIQSRKTDFFYHRSKPHQMQSLRNINHIRGQHLSEEKLIRSMVASEGNVNHEYLLGVQHRRP